MARVLAWSSVKLPEIWTCPSNEVKVGWVGWVIGAEMTWPSRSMPMMAWNCCLGQLVPLGGPGAGEVEVDRPGPLLSWALADLTACAGHAGRAQHVALVLPAGRGAGQQDGGVLVVAGGGVDV